jgi:hypothetical protein
MLNTPHIGTAMSTKNSQTHEHSFRVQCQLQEVVRTLSEIDAEHRLKAHEVECSVTDDELKESMKHKLRAAHRERREPYVHRLEELRKHKHSKD